MKTVIAAAGLGAALVATQVVAAGPASAHSVDDLEQLFCSAMDANKSESTVRQFVLSGTSAGVDTDTIAAVTVDAVTDVCPRHRDFVLGVASAWANS